MNKPSGAKKLLVLTVLVGAMTLVGVPSAQGHFIDSDITGFDVDDNTVRKHQKVTFFGKLKTRGHSGCNDNARVELVRKGDGAIDSTRTDNQGEFSFRFDPQPNRGKYFARYNGSGRFGYGNGHRCSAASSDRERIRPRR